jgi:hypothetical protein
LPFLHRICGRTVALAFAFLALPRAAFGADDLEPTALEYRVEPADDVCPAAVAFRDGIAARLGYDPFTANGARVLRARVGRSGASFRGVVELYEGPLVLGSKTLAASRCDELVSSMTLAASMAIDPMRVLRPPQALVATEIAATKAETSPTPPPVAQLTLSTDRDRAETRSPPVVPRVFASAGVAGLGPVRGVAAAFGVGAGLRYRAVSLDLEGHFVAPSSTEAGAGQVTTTAIGVALLPCVHTGPLFFCGELLLGELHGSAEGIDNAQQATTFLSQAGVRVGASIPFSRVYFEPFVDGLATLTTTEFEFRGADVWSSRPFGFTGGVRVALPFP